MTFTQVIAVNVAAPPAGDYVTSINGVEFVYTSPGGESDADIAVGMAASVTNGSTIAQATAALIYAQIEPRVVGTELLVTARGPTVGAVTVFQARDFNLYLTNWVGQDNNPYPF